MLSASFTRKFGIRLKGLRKGAVLTQDQVAERTGRHVGFVASIERGQRTPSLESIVLLAKALEVDIADLLRGLVAVKPGKDPWARVRKLVVLQHQAIIECLDDIQARDKRARRLRRPAKK